MGNKVARGEMSCTDKVTSDIDGKKESVEKNVTCSEMKWDSTS
ncbi:MAG: hypothetical protein ABIE74_04150 [Pseudomonadota bacterium]